MIAVPGVTAGASITKLIRVVVSILEITTFFMPYLADPQA